VTFNPISPTLGRAPPHPPSVPSIA
jgi:hypothetical protein